MAITSPADLSGLDLWLDAQDESTITKTGDAVTLWEDKSTSGFDVADSGAGPLSGTRSYNNNNVIEWTLASGNNRLISSSHSNIPQPGTVFIRGGWDADADNHWLYRGGSSGNPGLRRTSTGKARVETFGGNFSATTPLTDSLFTFVANGASSELRAEEVQVATGNIGSNGLSVAIQVGQGGECWVGELIRYNRVLSPTEIADVEAYLESHWADSAVSIIMLPPTGWDFIEMATTSVPADSIVFGDTFAVGDQVAFETTANHSLGSTGVVVLDEFGVPTITGTDAAGDWTFDYKIKDSAGDNSATYTVTITVS